MEIQESKSLYSPSESHLTTSITNTENLHYLHRVEPLNSKHIGTRHFDLQREVVLSSEAFSAECLDIKVCPLAQGLHPKALKFW